MKLTERITELENNIGFDLRETIQILEAVSEVFPMIVMANLTKNTYTMIRNDNFLAFDMPRSGCYDDLIDDGENYHTFTELNQSISESGDELYLTHDYRYDENLDKDTFLNEYVSAIQHIRSRCNFL